MNMVMNHGWHDAFFAKVFYSFASNFSDIHF